MTETSPLIRPNHTVHDMINLLYHQNISENHISFCKILGFTFFIKSSFRGFFTCFQENMNLIEKYCFFHGWILKQGLQWSSKKHYIDRCFSENETFLMVASFDERKICQVPPILLFKVGAVESVFGFAQIWDTLNTWKTLSIFYHLWEARYIKILINNLYLLYLTATLLQILWSAKVHHHNRLYRQTDKQTEKGCQLINVSINFSWKITSNNTTDCKLNKFLVHFLIPRLLFLKL